MKRVALIFGGKSSEHEVSCVSAATVAENLDKEKYQVILIGITKEGKWLLADEVSALRDGSWTNSQTEVLLSPSMGKTLLLKTGDKTEECEIDVAFPMLHGLWGEDGTIQGLFEMADIPYVGCGTLSSAVCMDKLFTKTVVEHAGIAQADYVPVFAEELENRMDEVIKRIEESEPYPVFVKPSNAGSSVGITKAHDREELKKGLAEAARHDRKILVEVRSSPAVSVKSLRPQSSMITMRSTMTSHPAPLSIRSFRKGKKKKFKRSRKRCSGAVTASDLPEWIISWKGIQTG